MFLGKIVQSKLNGEVFIISWSTQGGVAAFGIGTLSFEKAFKELVFAENSAPFGKVVK